MKAACCAWDRSPPAPIPGPACYGKGDRATVTDAHVVLGRIAADQFLGGEMHIDVSARRSAPSTAIARAALDRPHRRGRRYPARRQRQHGAGHPRGVGRARPRSARLRAEWDSAAAADCTPARSRASWESASVLVPQYGRRPLGAGHAAGRSVRDYSASALHREDLEARFRELERRARRDMPGCRLERSADLRYVGQSYELNVPWQPREIAAPVSPGASQDLRLLRSRDGPSKSSPFASKRPSA